MSSGIGGNRGRLSNIGEIPSRYHLEATFFEDCKAIFGRLLLRMVSSLFPLLLAVPGNSVRLPDEPDEEPGSGARSAQVRHWCSLPEQRTFNSPGLFLFPAFIVMSFLPMSICQSCQFYQCKE